jgi:hypothetical protein
MKTRVVLVIALWAALAVGAVTVFEAAAVPVGVLTVLAGLVLAVRAIVRRSRRREPVWTGAGESDYPPGPRRVLLADTGLALTHPGSRPRA